MLHWMSTVIDVTFLQWYLLFIEFYDSLKLLTSCNYCYYFDICVIFYMVHTITVLMSVTYVALNVNSNWCHFFNGILCLLNFMIVYDCQLVLVLCKFYVVFSFSCRFYCGASYAQDFWRSILKWFFALKLLLFFFFWCL